MATLEQLDAAGVLHLVESPLEAAVPERLLYATGRLRQWFEEVLPSLRSSWAIEISPVEQVADLIEQFSSGEELPIGQRFRCLKPLNDGVWELKTADVRIFGWFYKRDVFIGHCADLAGRVKEIGLYRGYMGEVTRFRDQLDIDPPKLVEGNDPNAVVSNCY